MEENTNKEEILANFQQITAIDDIGIAISHLESTGWDLETAIRLAIIEVDPNENVNEIEPPKKLSPTAGPSTSSSHLTFNIQFKNESFKISLSDRQTVGDLKQQILRQTSVPKCRQNLKLRRDMPISPINDFQNDSTILKSLNLQSSNVIELNDLSLEGFVHDNAIASGSSLNLDAGNVHQLRIFFSNEDRYLNLNFPSFKTILDIKNDLNAVLKIPVRFQVWEGWPDNSTNESKLSEIEIKDVHFLKLTSTHSENNSTRTINENNLLEVDSDSDSIEFEDATADEDIFTETIQQNRLKFLIEDGIDDEILGCLQFVSNYKDRYGHGPIFYEGSLDDALKTAYTSKSAKDRKLLAIYLHHDNSVLSNVFCGQLLGNENITKLLNENYVLFGWDLTCESNKNMFLSSLTGCVTDSASLQIRNMPINQFPIIIIVRKYRSVCEVADIIQGNINRDELYIHLMMNSDTFNEQMKIEIREENERNAREVLLKEQQQAYQESLLADRAKEEEKLRIERWIKSERQKQESERMETEARKEAEQKDAQNSLPPEPIDDNCQQITKVRFRKPTGEFIERKFTIDTQLKILLNFATANGFSPVEFKVISSYPRRDLTLLDSTYTLKQLNLYPQETLILEER